jgi:hypothetical protein
MVTGRLLDVKKTQTKSGKDIFYANVQVGQVTIKYQCWDAAIEGMAGKEISFTVKESDNPAFAATLILPRGDGSSGFAKKPWSGGGGKVSDPNTTKTMLMAYSKDLIVEAMKHTNKEHTPVGLANSVVAIYRILLGEIEPKPLTPEHIAKSVGGKVVNDDEVPF